MRGLRSSGRTADLLAIPNPNTLNNVKRALQVAQVILSFRDSESHPSSPNAVHLGYTPDGHSQGIIIASSSGRFSNFYAASPFLFVTEGGGPITEATVRKLVARAGERAGIGLPVHPHMLRHATGFNLANNGVDTRTIQGYLGHRNIMHTVRYTQLSLDRFRTLWRD
jgi:integrase